MKGDCEFISRLMGEKVMLEQKCARYGAAANQYRNALKSIIDVCEEHRHDAFDGAQANKLIVGILNIANYAAYGTPPDEFGVTHNA